MERITYLDRYQVVPDETGAPAVLRRSGQSVTYKALEIDSGAEVAVEVIPAFGLRSAVREELECEALAAKELSHINVPTLHAFGTEADQVIYASEYFEGTSAEAWVEAHGPMPVGPVLRIALQVVSALGAAAFHGIVHPAISPRNIILVPGQTPGGDWPLVKILDLVGSHAAATEADFASKFASPEQLQDGTVDFRAEVYSLGSTLWFLLTGAAPAAGLALPRVSGIPKPVKQLITLMVSPNADDRPHDPLVLQEHIRGCLEQVERREAIGRKFGVPIPAAVPVIKREPRRPIPWKPVAIAALLLAMAGLAVVLWPENIRPGQWFTGFGQPKPLGVPVGVPVESSPLPEAVVSNAMESSTPPQSATTADNHAVAQTAPPPPPVASSSDAESPQLVAKTEDRPAPADEPEPPSEGPDETDAPPSHRAEEHVAANQVPETAASPPPAPEIAVDEPAPARVLPRLERPVASGPAVKQKKVAKAEKRPKRIEGREVRAALPVDDETPPPGLPARSRRARFIGIAPDGSLVFELPSSERGFVAPGR